MKSINEIVEEMKYLNLKLKEVEKRKKDIEDKKFAIWAGRIIGTLIIIGAIGGLKEDPSSSLIALLIFLPVTIWAFTQSTDFSEEEKKINKLKEKIVEKLNDVEEMIKDPNKNGLKLEEINVNVKKKENEKFYFESSVILIKPIEKEIDYGGVVGTPVKVFGQTVFIGGGRKEKKKVEELSVIDEGKLYISNFRLLFIGNKKKYEIKLKDILSYSFDLDRSTLKISSEKLDDILFFKFNEETEPLKAFLIISILSNKNTDKNYS